MSSMNGNCREKTIVYDHCSSIATVGSFHSTWARSVSSAMAAFTSGTTKQT